MSIKRAVLGVVLGLLWTAVYAQVGTITTIGGTGLAGYSNDGEGGPATSAGINTPAGIAVDSAGNIYIALAERIRKISPAGIITTVAGTGIRGYSGDGGPAISAQVNRPLDVAVDSADNLIIADSYSHVIRKISKATGVITTIAGRGTAGFSGDGGQATVASLDTPHAVAVDRDNNIYIADTSNNSIRKISASTGVITTIATVSRPLGVFVDLSFDVYVTVAGGRELTK